MKHKRAVIATLVAMVGVLLPLMPAQAATWCGDTNVDGIDVANIQNYSHNGLVYQVKLCFVDDFSPWRFEKVVFAFNDASSPGQLRNDKDGQGNPIATKIEIQRVRFQQTSNGHVVQACDQNNNYPGSGPGDGGGCDYGEQSQGSGPCQGQQDIQAHLKAFYGHTPACGANQPQQVDFSEVEWVDWCSDADAHLDTDYTAHAEFYIKWNDGTVSPLKTLEVGWTSPHNCLG